MSEAVLVACRRLQVLLVFFTLNACSHPQRGSSMNAQSNAGKTPSIEQFTGYYNIPEEADLSYPVLQTVDQVPEYCFPEMWDVYLAAKKWFAEARPPLPKERFDPLAEDIFDPRDGANDRT